MYEEYFQNVLDVYEGKGWYERHPERFGLYYLHRKYPVVDEVIDYGKLQAEETPMANRLAIWIKSELDPSNVLDIGCGPGHFVESLLSKGLVAKGIDQDDRVIGKSYLEQKSLFDNTDTADVVLCLEVAEHIDDSRADDIVKTVSDATKKYLIWTAAQPGQGGEGHINCQPKNYWLDKFVNAGLTHAPDLQEQLYHYIKGDLHLGWFTQNLLVFKR
jgi:SAM-dependent methyltransferase